MSLWPKGYKMAFCFSFDVDFDSAWRRRLIDNKLPEDEQVVLSIGKYGAKKGLKRILNLLDKYKIKATFFIPGIIAEKYKETISSILKSNHEIGHHGYDHITPLFLSEEDQKNEIIKGLEALKRNLGVTPLGYRAPGEGLGKTLNFLVENGLIYDSSMMDDDLPYIIEVGDRDLVEIPWRWVLDDYPFYAFNYYPPLPYKHSPPVDSRTVLQIWKDEFDYLYQEGLFMTIIGHPHQIGQPSRIMALEEFIRYILSKKDVWIVTYGELAKYVLSNKKEFKA
jgi:peptidoglycan/xylan/chitin deacetylase (PgdA/CDA1 family)